MYEYLGWNKMSGGVSVDFWPIKCALQWDIYERLLASVFFTPALILLSVLFSVLYCRFKREKRLLDLHFVTGCAVKFVYLMFPSTIKSLLQIFDCVHVPGKGSWLRAEMEVQCYVGPHVKAMIGAGLCLCVWGLAVPLAVLNVGRGKHSKLHGQPRFKFLFDGYLKERKWWEAVILLRKLFMSCLTVFIRDTTIQGTE
jgi:hypothetical protein